jgi:exodeoxyribonuclease VII large subunit
MPEIANNRKIYSLLEISSGISRAISRAFPDYYWVKAEITKLNFYPKSGHCYPDLVEKHNGLIKAQIRANIWAGNFNKINEKFKTVTGEPLKDGLKILFLAKVNYHEHYGLALNILDVEPSFTLGEMAREKQLTVEKLIREGLLEENRKRPLPLLPKRVAVISVETSKGYSDFKNVLEKNAWHYRFALSLFPALLQGDGAVSSISAQLSAVASRHKEFDVVTIIRGGGGDVGLNAYDNYHLAKAVALCPLPVITGIGHSTNLTVVQMVAFANKITPTEAGHFLIQQFHNFAGRLENAEAKIERYSLEILTAEKQHFSQSAKMFAVHTRNLFSRHKTQWVYLMRRLEQSVPGLLVKTNEQLISVASHLKYQPVQKVRNEMQKLGNVQRLLEIHTMQSIRKSDSRLGLLESKISLLKPENILKKGYSISTVDGKILRSADAVKSGQRLKTKLYKGEIESVIEKKTKQNRMKLP